MTHTSVLLQEAIDGLNLKSGEIFLDCTLGSAGHAIEVFKRFGSGVRIIGIDADSKRAIRSEELLKEAGCTASVVVENFRNLDHVLANLGIGQINAILFDLGLNSEQLEESGKGFSFLHDEPLLMTFAEAVLGTLTAREIVNVYDREEIARILYEYGGERYSRRIAEGIVTARKVKSIERTSELVSILARVLPKQYERGRIHFATRTFQALRVAVNDELGALSEGISKAVTAVVSKGRVAVISFQSSEDGIVKHFFKNEAVEGRGVLITKKPFTASLEEIHANPRSRSAKLRIFEKN